MNHGGRPADRPALLPPVAPDGTVTFTFTDAPAAEQAPEEPAAPPAARRAVAALAVDRVVAPVSPFPGEAAVAAPAIEAAAVAEEAPIGAAPVWSATTLRAKRVGELRELAAAAGVAAGKKTKADLIQALLAAASA